MIISKKYSKSQKLMILLKKNLKLSYKQNNINFYIKTSI